ncbi:MAG: hypothetical protein K1X53_01385 [Candidatus Sumerlaeaceae bacterium]|nr:hypothetical protein [Candidatus Sumerlaeaceae bacterium]
MQDTPAKALQGTLPSHNGKTQQFAKRHPIGSAIGLYLFVHGFYLFSCWYNVTRFGSWVLLWWAFLPMVLAAFGAAVLGAAGLVGLCFRRVRRDCLILMLGGAVYLLLAIPTFRPTIRLGNLIRMDGFRSAASRAEPLIAALWHYHGDHQKMPEDLNQLVPSYLPEIPATGLGLYPEFKYSRLPTGAKDDYGNSWTLVIPCTSGGVNFDTFRYHPSGVYPKDGFGGSLERVGDWAYVHE